MSYRLDLKIDKPAFTQLVEADETFCIARKVNGRFTTAFLTGELAGRRAREDEEREKRMRRERFEDPRFGGGRGGGDPFGRAGPSQSYAKELIARTEFGWEDKFRVHEAKESRPGMMEISGSDPVDVAFGQMMDYNNRRDFHNATSAPAEMFTGGASASNAFIIKGLSSRVRVGIDILGEGRWAPVYVQPDPRDGDVTFVVENEISIFWDRNVRAGQAVDEGRAGNAFHVVYGSGERHKTVRFGYKKEDQPDNNESPSFYLE